MSIEELRGSRATDSRGEIKKPRTDLVRSPQDEALRADEVGIFSPLDLDRAELDMNYAVIIAELHTLAANVREHSREKLQAGLEKAIGLAKMIEIDLKTREKMRTHESKAQKMVASLLFFIPVFQLYLRQRYREEERTARAKVMREEIIEAAKRLADVLDVDITDSISELKRERDVARLEQIKTYIHQINKMFEDIAIKSGFIVLSFTGDPNQLEVNGINIKTFLKGRSCIPNTEDMNNVRQVIDSLLKSIGSSVDNLVLTREIKQYSLYIGEVRYCDLSDLRRRLDELRSRYIEERTSLEKKLKQFK